MTRIIGNTPIMTPCCGAQYKTPAYASISYWPRELWTDGRMVGDFVPDLGLRSCRCGRFFLISEVTNIETVDSTSLPLLERVPDRHVSKALASDSLTKTQEIVVRQRLLMRLNDPYRKRYRELRRLRYEEYMAKTDLGPQPLYTGPFLYPTYQPSRWQRANLLRLHHLLNGSPNTDHQTTDMAEVLRLLGRFSEAMSVLLSGPGTLRGKLIYELIEQEVQAPMRYRIW